MRVLHVTGSLIEPLGGAEQYCLAVAAQQARGAHSVSVAAGWIDDAVAAALASEGIPAIVLPTRRPYSPDRHGENILQKASFHMRELVDSISATPASRQIESMHADVVHVHRFSGFGTSVLQVEGPRLVHTVHDFSLIDSTATLVRGDSQVEALAGVQSVRAHVIGRKIPPRVSMIFPSARTLERHRALGFPSDRFDSRVLPHGWPGEPKAEVRGLRPVLRFLFLGKLSDHKGVEMLLDAWGDGIEGARLDVAGDGPLAERVRGTASVTALGWLDETGRRDALEASDVMVFPSLWPENFPIVVAEAILAGLPVLTTQIASPPLVDDGRSGLLVAPNAADLRSAMLRMVRDRELVRRLASGAGERAHQLDMRRHVEALDAVYRAEP